ncbi:NADH dehydrogenase I chain F [Buchnera aphidicola (Cinara tujafilina)]|uniref:NADH-quinone oxidoreductase subunit F n=1 Tax=Buchnera aphidicola (Cinara tujafilina) TaxID=261317 RepID=F7WZT5_9GAMM|nr:NADH-quinone oxidoreductase subunit NuoF [Buchnera aphidicola]AEH39696.1 NADH dehydrogenase I chain F [Buchnera aphidicola (Cinara tujafilina)]
MMKKKSETHPLTWRLDGLYTPIWIEEYSNKNGYNALKKTLKTLSSQDIISLVTKSGLKGRGGAGFPTGLKWELMVKNSTPLKKRYLICNADEMEPGTYKDKLLMEYLPHQLIEGIILSAFALQAICGYIFLRGDYYVAEKNLNKALQEARYKGFLGKNILNSGFNFDLFLHTGAGRYICGEETALINSLEGKRANPRYKPPFPAHVGLWGCPTCVNNVETLSNIPSIVLNGVKWYKSLSNSIDSGTKLMGFSGSVKRAGVWELPLGITAREILEDYAHGMKFGCQLKTWQPGGVGTAFLSSNQLDTAMDFVSLQKIGSRLGTGLAIAVGHKIQMVSLLLNIETFFSRESCGLCTPCREGLPWIVKILQDLNNDNGQPGDIELLEELCCMLGPGKTFCAHAPGAISPLYSAIKLFRKEFQMCIQNKKERIKNNDYLINL